jgi:hypothetical protein
MPRFERLDAIEVGHGDVGGDSQFWLAALVSVHTQSCDMRISTYTRALERIAGGAAGPLSGRLFGALYDRNWAPTGSPPVVTE